MTLCSTLVGVTWESNVSMATTTRASVSSLCPSDGGGSNSSSQRSLRDTSPDAVGLVVMVTITIWAILGNAALCWVIYRNPSLRTIPNMFVLNLALCDLLTAVLNGPFTILALVHDSWILGDRMCQMNGFLTTLFGVASVVTLAAISVNRCGMIVYAASSSDHYTARNTNLAIIGVWLFSAACAFPPMVGWSRYSYIHGKAICTLLWSTDISYTVVVLVLGVFLPFSSMMLAYFQILRKVRESRRKVWSQMTFLGGNGGERANKTATFVGASYETVLRDGATVGHPRHAAKSCFRPHCHVAVSELHTPNPPSEDSARSSSVNVGTSCRLSSGDILPFDVCQVDFMRYPYTMDYCLDHVVTSASDTDSQVAHQPARAAGETINSTTKHKPRNKVKKRSNLKKCQYDINEGRPMSRRRSSAEQHLALASQWNTPRRASFPSLSDVISDRAASTGARRLSRPQEIMRSGRLSLSLSPENAALDAKGLLTLPGMVSTSDLGRRLSATSMESRLSCESVDDTKSTDRRVQSSSTTSSVNVCRARGLTLARVKVDGVSQSESTVATLRRVASTAVKVESRRSRGGEELKLTLTLFVVILVFAVSWAPISIVNCLETFGSFRIPHTLDRCTVYMVFLQSAVNPVIYGLMNKNFRDGFKAVFPCGRATCKK